jgi:hypothetical protein
VVTGPYRFYLAGPTIFSSLTKRQRDALVVSADRLSGLGPGRQGAAKDGGCSNTSSLERTQNTQDHPCNPLLSQRCLCGLVYYGLRRHSQLVNRWRKFCSVAKPFFA